MKTRISLLCAAGALVTIVSGCTTPELSQTPYSAAESQWAEYIGSSYSEWKPPRTSPPSSNTVAAEPVVLPDQVIVPAISTPVIEQAPTPLPPAPPAPVQAVEKKKVEAQTYTIQKGDTLSTIAKKVYGKSSKWNVILDANKGKISDAGKLKVGMKINIPAQ